MAGEDLYNGETMLGKDSLPYRNSQEFGSDPPTA